MCCEDLVCARCAGPVVEARCPACRSARNAMHQHSSFTLSPQVVAIIVAVLSVLSILAAHHV